MFDLYLAMLCVISAGKCRPMILVSRSVRHGRIFAGVSWGGASNDSGVVEDCNFHRFY